MWNRWPFLLRASPLNTFMVYQWRKMLKHVQISPHRNRSDSVSLRSSISSSSSLCGSPEPHDSLRPSSRASSYCSLNETMPQVIKNTNICFRFSTVIRVCNYIILIKCTRTHTHKHKQTRIEIAINLKSNGWRFASAYKHTYKYVSGERGPFSHPHVNFPPKTQKLWLKLLRSNKNIESTNAIYYGVATAVFANEQTQTIATHPQVHVPTFIRLLFLFSASVV